MSTETTAPAQAGQYLTFELAGEEYALDILHVREILRFEEVTRVPTAPPSVRGVLNLRGSVVPVVDLAVRFGLPETVETRRTCIVIVEVAPGGEPLVMGVMADAVSQVMDLLPGDIEPPPSFGTRVRIEFLRGLARVGSRFALLLDLDRLLGMDEAAAAEAPFAADRASAALPGVRIAAPAAAPADGSNAGSSDGAASTASPASPASTESVGSRDSAEPADSGDEAEPVDPGSGPAVAPGVGRGAPASADAVAVDGGADEDA
ncbi:MAG: CheW protein [Gemmatimonadetes bacterium]|nr:CheW protein [Gemmatimonadota bacterium]